MNMIRFYSPARLAHMMQQGPMHTPARHTQGTCHTPSANVIEKDDQYELEMAIPGMSKEDIRIDLEKNVLTISSDKEAGQQENITYNRREFAPGKFCRSFSLPETVNREQIRADYRDGLLRVMLPKHEQARAHWKRSIEIA
ncbi:MAG: Hsp20/alpha crystallin family protein [Lentimicrobiaceae bacterium]|nr:Hsp20/alpha crystallin family protein [Lentimicrobiaceae bacterium]